MNKAIVICYTGRQIQEAEKTAIENIISEACDATQNLIITTRLDESDIAKALLKKSVEDSKISFIEDPGIRPTPDTVCITFVLQDCCQKLRVVKYIREAIDCGLKAAKEMVDRGTVYVPKSWNDGKIYAFVKGLHICKATITSGIEDIAMIYAAIFLNETYGKKDGILLVRDFAAATYHFHTDGANEEERALLAAVELVKNHPINAARWVFSELVNVINSL